MQLDQIGNWSIIFNELVGNEAIQRVALRLTNVTYDQALTELAKLNQKLPQILRLKKEAANEIHHIKAIF